MTRAARGVAASGATVAVWTALLLLLYLVLISTVSPLEWGVGGGLAVLGGFAADAVRRAEHPAARPGRRTAAALAALPLTLLRETAGLAAVVVRALRRRHGGVADQDPLTVELPAGTDAALATALLSATPGACVVDVGDRERGGERELRVHLLGAGRPPSAVERALGVRRPR
jgi:multisubunit Na+/H+ antiporter MnhE subunit